jgi:hypothetical protein
MDDGGPGSDASMSRAGLPPGKYNVPVMRMPGYAVSSITLNGTPVPLGASIELESPESVLTYVLTTQLGSVTGTVRDSDRQAVAEAAVVLAPESFGDSGEEMVTADGGGRFVFSGLAAGRYRVIALDGGDRRRAMDAAVIRERMKAAEVVVVSAAQNTVIDVEVAK